jgi:uncharacterized protein
VRNLPHGALALALLGSALATPCSPALSAQTQVARFPLADVQLLDSPFKRASERNARYLLSLDPDRLLHNTREYAGLAPKAELYGGWESQGIAGHTLGHYLSALALQFAASGDKRFRERIDYIVAEMAEAQRAYGDGYIGALPALELQTLRDLKQGKVAPKNPFFFENGAWVPWYTQHKILAGLRDAWLLGGNLQAKEVVLRLADWVDDVTSPLTDAQLQTMLQVEHGGMVEVLLDLYAATGNERYRTVSRRFEHRAVLEPLRSDRDELAGKHANTQIPKITGAARSYEATGAAPDRVVAEQFWRRVVREHSWAIGGNSDAEHFFAPLTAADHLSAATAETCNTYNMLKLTEHLFTWKPHVEYADYYERALYNHILASQEPRLGMFTYFMSLKPGHFRTYSTPEQSFWCCVGSGMENHAKYGSAIYFHDSDDVYVNLFIPSVLRWRENGLMLEQHTDYPVSNRIQLIVRAPPSKRMRLLVRAPGWATSPLAIQINGKPLVADAAPGRYVAIERRWQRGDIIDIVIAMAVRAEALRGSPDQIALIYGPAVLAGDLGPAPSNETTPYAKDQRANLEAPGIAVPILAGDTQSVMKTVTRLPGEDLAFRMPVIGQPAVTLRPFSAVHFRRYNVYWTLRKQAVPR